MPATLFVKHKVADYKTWKLAYDGLGPVRKRNGVTSASVHRDAHDPALVTVIHGFNDVQSATRFASLEELKSAMTHGGVTGAPEIWFSEEMEHTSY